MAGDPVVFTNKTKGENLFPTDLYTDGASRMKVEL
jgi:hypothetical protein